MIHIFMKSRWHLDLKRNRLICYKRNNVADLHDKHFNPNKSSKLRRLLFRFVCGVQSRMTHTNMFAHVPTNAHACTNATTYTVIANAAAPRRRGRKQKPAARAATARAAAEMKGSPRCRKRRGCRRQPAHAPAMVLAQPRRLRRQHNVDLPPRKVSRRMPLACTTTASRATVCDSRTALLDCVLAPNARPTTVSTMLLQMGSVRSRQILQACALRLSSQEQGETRATDL